MFEPSYFGGAGIGIMAPTHTHTRISPQLEDYLETIFDLIQATGTARPRDIAGRLEVHKSTVTAALRSLADKRLINYAPYEMATLTDDGLALALEVRRRHQTLKRFLADVLMVDDATAETNACRLEHAIDGRVWRRLDQMLEYLDETPDGPRLREGFARYCRVARSPRPTA